MTKHDPFLVKTVREKEEMIQAASLGHFHRFNFSYRI